MVRLLLKLVVWVTFARWLYAEAAIVVPSAVPYIKTALHYIQIPTHDKWRDSPVGKFVEGQLPSRNKLKAAIATKLDFPIKESAGMLRQVADSVPHSDIEVEGF